MKNLNVNLAENFRVNIYMTNFGFKTYDKKKEQIKLFVKEFLEGLIKRNIFPEKEETFEIISPPKIYEDEDGREVVLYICPKNIGYCFNKKFELQHIYINKLNID